MSARSSILIRGARENNLKNIDVELPRDQLIVLTGLSGSGKSSLAFDTLYAEAQRRFMESLSTWSRRFIQQQSKPKVDGIFGLSPVISIEQKTVVKNPRSTVGTMTDIGDYLRVLFATVGETHCRFCAHAVPTLPVRQLAEHLLALPEGTVVELCAPLERFFGEDTEYFITQIRSQGVRRLYVEDALVDLAEGLNIDDDATPRLEALVDRYSIKPHIEKQLLASLEHAARLGEGFVRVRLPDEPAREAALYPALGCPEHRLTMTEVGSWYFSFNEAESACLTCSGLGTYLRVHTGLLVPDPTRSLNGGAFTKEAFHIHKDNWNGRVVYTLAQHFGFSLDTPFQDLSEAAREALFFGMKGQELTLLQPPGGADHRSIGRPFKFDGVANQIERWYRWYRRKQEANSNTEDWLRKVMVEAPCPECNDTRLRRSRLCTTVGDGLTIHRLSQLTLADAAAALRALPSFARNPEAGEQLCQSLVAQLDLLCAIGLDYLSLNRRSGTLSGGESQRIRLSTQISSELMGMLYVLDEPSIGLHPKDNEKLIATLHRLRDIGNTVIVVEHDTDTIAAADYVVEIGPGPGIHGGQVVAQGTPAELQAHPDSLTGAFMAGRRTIPLPTATRSVGEQGWLTVTGARENNLQNLTARFPLGALVCVTGASGSGKSTLIHEILFKKLWSLKHDSRVLAGEHDALEGAETIDSVIEIDQAPIGRSPRSNPATYVGFYDEIRTLFAGAPLSVERGYTASRFSFNVKGGRCEECAGEGNITTQLNFLPDVETLCPACKGTRYNAETLEVTHGGKNIADVLGMSIEEGVIFFAGNRKIAHKLSVLNDLGLGYLTLGHPATLLSGGEAQRVKLATELAKLKRGTHNLYILDEPTTGLHLADIQRLLECLNRLVAAGNSVLVIEHHLDVIKCADWVIDLGPDGGKNGGRLVVEGPPAAVAACTESHTGRFLQPYL